MLLLVSVFDGVGAGIVMPVLASVTSEFDNAVPVYVVCEAASHSVLLTPKLVESTLPFRYQFAPPTRSVAATLPPLSLSVTSTFVGTFAEATIEPNDMEFGDGNM